MRVATETRQLDINPGSTAAVVVDVVNTGAVIDGVSARVIGLPDECVRAEPALLPLFPDASGQLTLSLTVPPTLPAGRHPLTLEVVSHGARLPSQYVDVDLDVTARPGLALRAQPRMIRARKGARFVLELVNDGNIALDIELAAVDTDRVTRTELTPQALRLEAGAMAPVLLSVRGPRMITGGEIDRTVTVQALARPQPARPLSPRGVPSGTPSAAPDLAPPTTPDGAPGGAIDPAHSGAESIERREATVRLRQRPLLSRGLLTALILASIIALWAGVFLLGLTKVFSGDPMTKQAPASFFLAPAAGSAAGGGTGSGAGPGKGVGDTGSATAAAAPADALPKTGLMPAGTGGSISGTVRAATDGQPVGRILVQALRMSRTGLTLVSSAATQSDGTYTLSGLFPTSYFVEFSAPGYRSVWYPGAPGQSGAKQVGAPAQGLAPGVDAVIKGLPATISGNVSPGDTLKKVITTVTARPLLGNAAPVTTKTNASGGYHLAKLPAPGTYELTFTAVGYQASTLVDSVAGGDARLEPTVTLGASSGQIGGVVSDGTNPIGGATVTTTLNGKPLTVTTPTTGQVGAYVLANLQTPGTYVVTYSAPGHGSVTSVIDLDAGQSVAAQNVTLVGGTGSVSGDLRDADGHLLGGATVTVGGAATTQGGTPPTTTTLTSGQVGAFAISGLAAPGSYTLTFSLEGYAPATVRVELSANGAPPTVHATLATRLGSIKGRIREVSTQDGVTSVLADPFTGATVTATNGAQTWTVASSAAGGDLPQGGYLIAGLQPGTYSVTVTAAGLVQQTGIVTVVSGSTKQLNLTLTKQGG